MQPLKISAKNLGYTALADFCPRCYWIKLRLSHKMPFSVFPGIFSSIDGFTKSCVHHIIDSCRIGGNLTPDWMREMGNIVGYNPVPHYSKSTYLDEKTNITLSGAADDILVDADDSLIVPDYKTAKFTESQDKLLPMYEIQLITYGILYRIQPLLFCVYMEPQTEKTKAADCVTDCGFHMEFSAHVLEVQNDRSKVRAALVKTREIFELESPPDSAHGCKDCLALNNVIGALGMGKVSSVGLKE